MSPLLTRSAYGNSYTAGVMSIGAVTFYSIEQPWTLNLVGHSCVPDGTYDLIPYESPAHGPTWCLQSDKLGISAAPAAGERSRCEIHAANWSIQLKGCIALGLDNKPMYYPATNRVEMAIENSRDAIKALLEILGPMSTGHTLTIVPAKGLTGTSGYVF